MLSRVWCIKSELLYSTVHMDVQANRVDDEF